MGSSKAQITAIAQVIAHSQGNANTLAIAFDEVMQWLAQKHRPALVYNSQLTVSTTSASFAYPTGAVEVLGVFYQGRQLKPVNSVELNAYNITWRASSGGPYVYYREEDDYESIRFFPAPAVATTGSWLYTQASSTNVPDYMVLYIAFAMLEREFAYPSDHQDKTFSKLCGDTAQIFGTLIGVV